MSWTLNRVGVGEGIKELKVRKELFLFSYHLKKKKVSRRIDEESFQCLGLSREKYSGTVFIDFSRTTNLKSNGNADKIALEVALKLIIETALTQTFLFIAI